MNEDKNTLYTQFINLTEHENGDKATVISYVETTWKLGQIQVFIDSNEIKSMDELIAHLKEQMNGQIDLVMDSDTAREILKFPDELKCFKCGGIEWKATKYKTIEECTGCGFNTDERLYKDEQKT